MLLSASSKGTEFLIRYGPGIPNVELMLLPDWKSFEVANDKWLFHEYARAHGLSSPQTWLADACGDLDAKAFPLLLKPRVGDGGNGIVLIDKQSKLTAIQTSRELCLKRFVIQEFIDGEDVGCSVFCRNGQVLASTIQKVIKRRRGAYSPAAAVQFIEHKDVFMQAKRVAEFLQWTGVAHFDMRIRKSDGKVFLLEMNPRFWASIYGSLRSGINFVSLNCLLEKPVVASIPSTKSIKYFQGRAGFVPWFQGCETDFCARISDPLPDLVRTARFGKEYLTANIRTVCGSWLSTPFHHSSS